MQAEELTAEFGIAGILDFVETEHGLVKAAISLHGMAGELYLQGAQLTAWQPPGERPVLFTSPNSAFAPGRAIRGGIPIIFPWFGASRHALAAPQHGFARTAPWHLDSVETAGRELLTLTFSLGGGDVGSPFWPEPFRAIYTVVFAQTLSLRLAVQNRATHPVIFEEALHTYFAISDITGIAISGLAGTTYIDKSDAARRKPQTAALVTITAETDSVYLDTPEQCAIEDRGGAAASSSKRTPPRRAWCGIPGPINASAADHLWMAGGDRRLTFWVSWLGVLVAGALAYLGFTQDR